MSIYLLDTFKFPAYGEVTFECAQNQVEWRVPIGVTSISAVLIGGGCGGGAGGNQTERSGGGAGGLRYINGLVVVPGETLLVKAGLGGTGHTTNPFPTVGSKSFGSNFDFKFNNPGYDSYIASNNNSNVTARAGIGGTIIVLAEGGGKFPSPTSTGVSVDFYSESFVGNNSTALATVGLGTSGGNGSTTGIFLYGTIGGGNGGHGGEGGKGTGGGIDGGGGGGPSWVAGTRGGFGGWYDGNQLVFPTNGTNGGGGGGMTSKGGGAYGGGGGGGTGMRWGIGPNGFRGSYNSDNLTNDDTAYSWGGQGGSFGRDGKAPGNELISYSAWVEGIEPTPSNYPNASDGNGLRGFTSDEDAIPTGPIPSNENEGSGGFYGGGGGGAQTGGTGGGFSGNGRCGVVRIIYAARPRGSVTRNYPGSYNTSLTIAQNVSNGWSGINTTNVLTSFGYPTLPPAAGGVPDFFGA